jgi:hypothetical protein
MQFLLFFGHESRPPLHSGPKISNWGKQTAHVFTCVEKNVLIWHIGHLIRHLEPILRLLNLQLQRQHCSRLHRAFFKEEKNIFVFKTN